MNTMWKIFYNSMKHGLLLMAGTLGIVLIIGIPIGGLFAAAYIGDMVMGTFDSKFLAGASFLTIGMFWIGFLSYIFDRG